MSMCCMGTDFDLSEMFHFFACLRLRFASEVVRKRFFPIAIFSIAIFAVIAIIACTAAKAFEDQTWTAFVILLVVSLQVLLSRYVPYSANGFF